MDKSDKLMILIIVFITTMVLSITLRVAVNKHRLDVEQGEIHCGDVEVTTPTGRKAYEHQCWRSK